MATCGVLPRQPTKGENVPCIQHELAFVANLIYQQDVDKDIHSRECIDFQCLKLAGSSTWPAGVPSAFLQAFRPGRPGESGEDFTR